MSTTVIIKIKITSNMVHQAINCEFDGLLHLFNPNYEGSLFYKKK